MFNAKTVEGFLYQAEVEKLTSFAKGVESWQSGGNEFWSNRTLNAQTVYSSVNKEIGELLFQTRERIKKAIEELYGLDSDVYPDLTQIVRWFPGMEQPPHCDDMTNSEGNDWFAHRHYGAIIYLNDDYEGGHTFYPTHEISITPKAGMLAIHPGDKEHLHGVTKVEGAIRYTVASFWTLDKEYFDGWSIS
jgi:hypothetical protein